MVVPPPTARRSCGVPPRPQAMREALEQRAPAQVVVLVRCGAGSGTSATGSGSVQQPLERQNCSAATGCSASGSGSGAASGSCAGSAGGTAAADFQLPAAPSGGHRPVAPIKGVIGLLRIGGLRGVLPLKPIELSHGLAGRRCVTAQNPINHAATGFIAVAMGKFHGFIAHSSWGLELINFHHGQAQDVLIDPRRRVNRQPSITASMP